MTIDASLSNFNQIVIARSIFFAHESEASVGHPLAVALLALCSTHTSRCAFCYPRTDRAGRILARVTSIKRIKTIAGSFGTPSRWFCQQKISLNLGVISQGFVRGKLLQNSVHFPGGLLRKIVPSFWKQSFPLLVQHVHPGLTYALVSPVC